MPQPLANVDGQIMPLCEVRVSAQDRGFLFGDAIYEVLRLYQGRPWLEHEHFERLRNSLAAIRIHGVDVDRLGQRIRETIAAGGFTEAMVYIQVTRGTAPRRHPFPAGATPLEFLFVQEYDDGPTALVRAKGTRVITCPDIRWGRCDVKSTNLLANVLANQAATEQNASEALLYLPDGTMSEASHSSFFTVRDGTIYTTPLKSNILPGITRNFLTRLARKAAIPVFEQEMRREDLFKMDEIFLTGTTSEVVPVIAVDDKPIGTGQPGPMAKRLLHLHQNAVREFLASPVSD
jgi:D-alanine transaminase